MRPVAFALRRNAVRRVRAFWDCFPTLAQIEAAERAASASAHP